jgi:hypothetical protein
VPSLKGRLSFRRTRSRRVRRARALDCRYGATLATAEASRFEVSLIPAEHRVYERMAHGAEQLAVVGEACPELEGQREYEVPQWRLCGKHVLDEIRGGFGHSSAQARWTKPQTLTREADDDAFGALRARQDCEASRKYPAVNVALELFPHEAGQWSRETLLDGGVERAQVVAHDLVQGALFRTPARVRWLPGHSRGRRNRRASRRRASPPPKPGDRAWRSSRPPAADRLIFDAKPRARYELNSLTTKIRAPTRARN